MLAPANLLRGLSLLNTSGWAAGVLTYATSGFLVSSLGTSPVYVGAGLLAALSALYVEGVRGRYRQRAQAVSEDLKRITQTQPPVSAAGGRIAR